MQLWVSLIACDEVMRYTLEADGRVAIEVEGNIAIILISERRPQEVDQQMKENCVLP